MYKNKPNIPSSLNMKEDTKLICTLPDGTKVHGIFRDAAPDGSYAIKINDTQGLMAFDKDDIELE